MTDDTKNTNDQKDTVAQNNNESKRQRFERLVTQRTNNVLYRLQVLGNCSNRSAYEYTEDDVKKIFTAIEEELQSVKAKFKDSKRRKFELHQS